MRPAYPLQVTSSRMPGTPARTGPSATLRHPIARPTIHGAQLKRFSRFLNPFGSKRPPLILVTFIEWWAMWPTLLILALLCVVSVHGQDLSPRPDPLHSLKEMLSGQKPFTWIQSPMSPGNSTPSTSVTGSITDVRVDVDACTLSLKDGRVFPNERYESVQTWQFRISDIDRVKVESLEGYVERLRSEGGQPSWATKTSPTVFVLEIAALPNQKFSVHRWSKNKANEVLERDLQQSSAFIVFPEEVGAREAEKAMQNAKAFCVSKGPR